ncbi:MAG TPA: succinate:quinone oxidoreductase, partial [Verrucomicrobiota bacterium]|nr:succinate:quinone oxidoreductase [Verrucomicrobiota bacterium]
MSNILGSSLGRKYLMALSGVGLFGFIVGHMLGNLTIFAGPAAINEYAAKLHGMGPLLWIARIGLLGMVGIHIWAAGKLTRENRKARSVRYEGAVDPVDRH